MRTGSPRLFSRLGVRKPLCVLCLGISLVVPLALPGQANQPQKDAEERLQRHYDAARTFQLSGDQEHAAAEYKAFLAGALNNSANAYANANRFSEAADLFEGALGLAPGDPDIRLDYAFMRLRQQKLQQALSLVEKVLAESPRNAKARALAGQILFAQADYQRAKEHLEAVVSEAPNFDVAYLLGRTYIKLNDLARARLLFDEMVNGLGNIARIHIYFGRAYGEGETDSLDRAIEEFNKAIARDPKIPQAHYFLALAYLNRDGESGFAEAVPELEAELKIVPEDARSYYLLGYIAMKQRDVGRAESVLLKAASLDPNNPDPFIYLGQLYADSGRESQADATMRKAIALTKDVSRNNYQVNRAHYVLGRVLMHAGKREEGERELNLSKDLRDRVAHPELARNQTAPEFAGISGGEQVTETEPPSLLLEQQKAATEYVNQLKPAIADAYNNLGVIFASQKRFSDAVAQFRYASEWNPALPALDRNWGMAAFYAEKYRDAIPLLTRHLRWHPDDVRARAALALSFFMSEDFAATLEALRPIPSAVVEDDPGLGYAYAVSLLRAGDYNQGVRRLQALEKANPDSADVHMLLGEAYAEQQDYATALDEYRRSLAINPKQSHTRYLAGLALLRKGSPADAVQEFRASLQLGSDNVATKYHLAYALIEAQQKQEAQVLLQEVIRQNPKYSDAFYQLGKLQLEHGDTKAAISNLETGCRLSPDSDYIHYQLAMAYRRDARGDDAEREIKLYQVLKNRHRGRDVPESK